MSSDFNEKVYFHLIEHAEKHLEEDELNWVLQVFFEASNHVLNFRDNNACFKDPMHTGETLFAVASYTSLKISLDIGRAF